MKELCQAEQIVGGFRYVTEALVMLKQCISDLLRHVIARTYSSRRFTNSKPGLSLRFRSLQALVTPQLKDMTLYASNETM